MKIAVCDDDKGCLDSMKRLLAGYPGISRTEYYQDLSQLSEALENGISKLPSYKALQAEIEALIKEKNSGYNDYRTKREEYRRLQTDRKSVV